MILVEGLVGEVYEEHGAEDCCNDCHETEDDEDPSPAFKTT